MLPGAATGGCDALGTKGLKAVPDDWDRIKTGKSMKGTGFHTKGLKCYPIGRTCKLVAMK